MATDLLDAHSSPRRAPEPIVLPTPAPPARRPPLPLVAAIVPVAAAGVMWLVTGSALMLLFAALGPLLALASVADAARTARRDRRTAAVAADAALAGAARELERVHAQERAARWAVEPDAGTLLQRRADVWRPAPERADSLVVGVGAGTSRATVVGGGDEPDAVELRRRAAAVEGVPMSIPLGVGVCVVGPRALAAAVARALALQACLVHAPDGLALVQVPRGETWADALPHRGGRGAVRVALVGAGEPPAVDADVVIAAAAPGAPVPRQCGAVLTLTGAVSAELVRGAERTVVVVEGISIAQAGTITGELAAAASTTVQTAPEAVRFGELLAAHVGVRRAAAVGAESGGLAVPVGRDREGVVVLDLVEDGPHAVVAGVTGSGKSELLVTWVAALCATRSPAEVCFLLADFKGGTAFDRLAILPHVTGVITDLDGAGARRAVGSLRAELRRREAELSRMAARDIRDPRVELPRLVVVVDEFAAMLTDHPELHDVFTDVAARGRALGMHLVLGTQRASGVVRDALLANCPLRVSLRVTDAADSRAVIGTDDAAQLSGDADARGLACVRRSRDTVPILMRIALTEAGDVQRIATQHAHATLPHRPWLPALPARLPLDALAPGEHRERGVLLLGRADEPERQRQPDVRLRLGDDRGLMVVGAPRSGKSTVLDLLAAQAEPGSVLRVPADPEGAWDAVASLSDRPGDDALVLVDDLDVLAGAFPAEYAAEFLGRIERAVRAAGSRRTTVVLTAQRLSGGVARIAELLPQRAVLPMATRLDHLNAGGEPATFDAGAPPGRAVLGSRVMQFAMPDRAADAPVPAGPAEWLPRRQVAALAVRAVGMHTAALAVRLPGHRIVRIDDLAPGVRAEELVEDTAAPVVIVGDPDGWQRQWSVWTRLRAEHGVTVSVACAAEFRGLTGTRELPPYAAADDRVWHVAPSGDIARLRLPRAEDC